MRSKLQYDYEQIADDDKKFLVEKIIGNLRVFVPDHILEILKTPRGQYNDIRVQLVLCLLYVYMRDYEQMQQFITYLTNDFGTSTTKALCDVFLDFLEVCPS